MSNRRTRLFALTCAAAVATTGLTAAAQSAPAAPAAHAAPSKAAHAKAVHPGLDRLKSFGTPTHKAIVTFKRKPTAGQLGALRGLGLTVQPLKRLPMALVAGPTAKLVKAAKIGQDVYPDEILQYDDAVSTATMSSSPTAAKALRSRGLTGKGVTVGIVDSGCDATHPDLAKRVFHNVTLLSPEYVNAGTSPILAVPLNQGPYSNTDIGSGHGTHVAGIIAADGTSGPNNIGVAPDAKLACFAIGAVISTTAVVSAYDYALAQPNMLGIDVFNNSWGNSFRQYDPNDPVNVATKKVSNKGAVVVFAAGNSGYENGEASVSPFNQAPWVLSVASGSTERVRADSSSNGLEFDNGSPVAIGQGGHTVFTGDRVGNTQPDVMAPGQDISSSCSSTGAPVLIGGCPGTEHGQATLSGTSMASPHVAGAAAVLSQANPRLTYSQIQRAMTASATPVKVEGKTLMSWQAGYGHVNLDKAVKLVTGKKWQKRLAKAQKKADRRLLAQDPYRVIRSDIWQDAATPVSGFGSYAATRSVSLLKGVSALKVTVVYPSTGQAGGNFASFTAVVKDAKGKVVGTTETNLLYSVGLAHVLVKGVKPGKYTIEVTSDYAVSDPDTIDSDSINGRVVFVQAAQLQAR